MYCRHLMKWMRLEKIYKRVLKQHSAGKGYYKYIYIYSFDSNAYLTNVFSETERSKSKTFHWAHYPHVFHTRSPGDFPSLTHIYTYTRFHTRALVERTCVILPVMRYTVCHHFFVCIYTTAHYWANAYRKIKFHATYLVSWRFHIIVVIMNI